jgi:hypothetical protein
VVATITTVLLRPQAQWVPVPLPTRAEKGSLQRYTQCSALTMPLGGTVVAEIGGGQLVVLPVRSYAAKAAVTALNSSFKLCLTT